MKFETICRKIQNSFWNSYSSFFRPTVVFIYIYIYIYKYIYIYIHEGRSESSKTYPEGVRESAASWKCQPFSGCALALIFLGLTVLIPKLTVKNIQLWLFFLGNITLVSWVFRIRRLHLRIRVRPNKQQECPEYDTKQSVCKAPIWNLWEHEVPSQCYYFQVHF